MSTPHDKSTTDNTLSGLTNPETDKTDKPDSLIPRDTQIPLPNLVFEQNSGNTTTSSMTHVAQGTSNDVNVNDVNVNVKISDNSSKSKEKEGSPVMQDQNTARQLTRAAGVLPKSPKTKQMDDYKNNKEAVAIVRERDCQPISRISRMLSYAASIQSLPDDDRDFARVLANTTLDQLREIRNRCQKMVDKIKPQAM